MLEFEWQNGRLMGVRFLDVPSNARRLVLVALYNDEQAPLQLQAGRAVAPLRLREGRHGRALEGVGATRRGDRSVSLPPGAGVLAKVGIGNTEDPERVEEFKTRYVKPPAALTPGDEFTARKQPANYWLMEDRAGTYAYNPEVARWTSEDPSGFPDGANCYSMVTNQVTIAIDELGFQTLKYSKLSGNYPTYSANPTTPYSSPNSIWSMIGGQIQTNGPSWQNSCAVRMSFALDKSGVMVNTGYRANGGGAYSTWQFDARAWELASFLDTKPGVVGKGSSYGSVSAFTNKHGSDQGIICFTGSGGGNHITLWDGSGSYITSTGDPDATLWGNATKIRFWHFE